MPECLRYSFLRRYDVRPCGRCPACLAVEEPSPPPPVDEATALRQLLEANGHVVDGRWKLKTLRTKAAEKGLKAPDTPSQIGDTHG